MAVTYQLTAPTQSEPLYLAHTCGLRQTTSYAAYVARWGGFHCRTCDALFERGDVEVGCPECAEPMTWGDDLLTCSRNPTHEWPLCDARR